MKYGNALYIVVALFLVMGISAMANPEATNSIGKKIIQSLASIPGYIGYNTGITETAGANTEIPEFPALIIPVATIIGLMFIFQHKKTKEKK